MPGTTAGWHTSAAGQDDRDTAAEAYRQAMRLLKIELGTAGDTQTSIENIYDLVEEFKRKYDNGMSEHLGVRKWLGRLSPRIVYYRRVFDVLAQHHPEHVALAWGALKFVLSGIINRAELVQEMSQALVAIGDALPRAELGAELYRTEHMEATLSRLYTYVIMFFQLCVRWYNRSSVGRLWSSSTSPFELKYKDLICQIKVCSLAMEDLANAGARAEMRNIHALLELHHSRAKDHDARLLQLQNSLEDSMTQLMHVTKANKSIAERMSSQFALIMSLLRRTASRRALYCLVGASFMSSSIMLFSFPHRGSYLS